MGSSREEQLERRINRLELENMQLRAEVRSLQERVFTLTPSPSHPTALRFDAEGMLRK